MTEEVTELREQLDAYIGGEEMIEQLTERNLDLGEKVTLLETTLKDLEALRDLNEELEEAHLETEKQLQLDLGTLDGSNEHDHLLLKSCLQMKGSRSCWISNASCSNYHKGWWR